MEDYKIIRSKARNRLKLLILMLVILVSGLGVVEYKNIVIPVDEINIHVPEEVLEVKRIRTPKIDKVIEYLNYVHNTNVYLDEKLNTYSILDLAKHENILQELVKADYISPVIQVEDAPFLSDDEFEQLEKEMAESVINENKLKSVEAVGISKDILQAEEIFDEVSVDVLENQIAEIVEQDNVVENVNIADDVGIIDNQVEVKKDESEVIANDNLVVNKARKEGEVINLLENIIANDSLK